MLNPMMTDQMRRRPPVYRPQNGLGTLGQGGYAPPEQSPEPVGAYAPPEGPPMQQQYGGYTPTEPGAYQQPPGPLGGVVPPNMQGRPAGNWGFHDSNRFPQPQMSQVPAWLRLQHMFGNGGGWG